MDRAERIVKARAKRRHWTPEQVDAKIARRRKWRRVGMAALETVAGAVVAVGVDAVTDRIQD